MNPRLKQQRAALVDSMRSLCAVADGQADLSSEDSEKFDKMKGELEGLDKRIERETWLDEADRRATGHALGDKHFEGQVQMFSLRRAIAAQAGLDVDAGLEREVSKELSKRLGMTAQGILVPLRVFQKRVITTALPAGGPGGNVIATELLAEEYIDMLRARLVTAQLGARVLTGLVGDVDIPRMSASAGATWVGENAAITATDAAFVAVQLRPRHVGTMAEYSRNLLLQSTPDIETLLRDDFAASIAVAIDTAALGAGSGVTPIGIAGRVTEVDATTGGLTWARIVGAMSAVETANGAVGDPSTGYVMTPGVKGLAMTKTKVANSTDSLMLMETPDALAGYRAFSTNCCPANSLYFGVWSDLLIGYWSAFDFLVNPYESAAYSKGNVLVRGMATCDVQVRHVESFAGVNNITA